MVFYYKYFDRQQLLYVLIVEDLLLPIPTNTLEKNHLKLFACISQSAKSCLLNQSRCCFRGLLFRLRDTREEEKIVPLPFFRWSLRTLTLKTFTYRPVCNSETSSSRMSRLTWIPQNFSENYSKDPNQAAVLLEALTHRNLSDFRYALEVMKCDPNLLDASSGLSVFQTVLQTPHSSELIRMCINSGANFYKVCAAMLIYCPNIIIDAWCFHSTNRKVQATGIQSITQSNHYVRTILESS